MFCWWKRTHAKTWVKLCESLNRWREIQKLKDSKLILDCHTSSLTGIQYVDFINTRHKCMHQQDRNAYNNRQCRLFKVNTKLKCFLQPRPRVLRMTKGLVFTKFAAPVFFFFRSFCRILMQRVMSFTICAGMLSIIFWATYWLIVKNWGSPILTSSNILACEALFVQNIDDCTYFLAGNHG